MVGAETGADVRDLPGLRVVEREMAPRPLKRKQLRGRMARALLAERRILRRPHRRRDPYPAFFIEHRVVDRGLARPDGFLSPERRRGRHLRIGRRRARIAQRQLDLPRFVPHRIEHREVVGALLERAIEQAVRIEGRIAAVGRHDIVQIGLRVRPVPHRDHDVALEPLRTRRGRRHLTLRDAVGPVGEHREGTLASEIAEPGDHARAGLAGLQPALPRLLRRGERPERRGNLPGRLVPELVAREARPVLQLAKEFRLTPHIRRDAVAGRSRARKLRLVRHLDQREPVPCRVVLRGGVRIRRHHGREVHRLAWSRIDLGGIHESVPPDPDAVGRLGQIGNQIPAAIVGDHDLGEARRQLSRFRDDPDAGLGPFRSAHDAANVVAVNRHRLTALLTRARGCQRDDEHEHRRNQELRRTHRSISHVRAPLQWVRR